MSTRKTKLSMALIIAVIFFGCYAAPKKEVVPLRPVSDDLDSKLTDLTNQIIFSLTETKKTRIAIIEFSDLEGNITEFGKYLSEELITRLFRTGRFKVIERHFLNKVIEEHKLSYTHFFDEKSVKEIGRFLGVDAIASGSVTDLGNSVKVNARLIDTETGSIFSVASVEILKDEKVARLLEKKAKSPYQEMVEKAPEASPSVPEKQKEKPSAVLQRVKAYNFTFELKECRMSGGSVSCWFLITNNDPDRVLLMNACYYHLRSEMFDDLGNEYIATQAQLANKKGKEVRILLVSDIPTRAALYFEGVSQQAKRIALLKINCKSSDKWFTVEFRNIPLSK